MLFWFVDYTFLSTCARKVKGYRNFCIILIVLDLSHRLLRKWKQIILFSVLRCAGHKMGVSVSYCSL